MMQVRPPAVAGAFYPADPGVLAAEVAALIDSSAPQSLPAGPPRALIVPHAGYIYSGPVAASAYALLPRGHFRRVLLLGPSHRVPVHGMALPTVEAFATPLGTVPLAREVFPSLLALPQVQPNDAAHHWEHSLEVQLPFLQETLGDFALIPLAVGQADTQAVAGVIELFLDDEATLVVVSSDLSHFLDHDTARQLDEETVRAIVGFNGNLHHDQACGYVPVNGLLLALAGHGYSARLLDLRDSSDAVGDRGRVVGYAAVAFYHE